MQAKKGDRIEVPGNKVGQPSRQGKVLEVREHPGQTMYRVEWEDGTESTFMPSDGSAVVVGR